MIIAPGFQPMPVRMTEDGALRRFGCEIEFAGMDEASVADALQSELGGTVDRDHDHLIHLRKSAIGTVRIALDTALPKGSDTATARAVTGLLTRIVPVEIISEPLLPDEVVALSQALDVLKDEGAKGSQDGAFYGFGVHLNAEVAGPNHPHTLRTIRAFAALELYLRDAYPIDLTRRILPFIKAWPDPFSQELLQRRPKDLSHVMGMAADHIKSRNYALDLYPLFKHAAPRAFDAFFPHDDTTKARPSFHFRLPDSRLGERGWSLREAWSMWRLVEVVADDAGALDALEETWLRGLKSRASIPHEDAMAETKAVLEAHLS